MPDLRTQIVDWNNRFPLDREWRRKYNVAFNSPEHRATSQLDIYLEWLENRLFDEAVEKAVKGIEMQKEYDEGNWLKKQEEIMTTEEDLDAFDKLDVTVLNTEE